MKTTQQLEDEYGAIDILCCSKDRHTEVSLMIQSLRTQTYKKWNLILLDDNSGTPMSMSGFLVPLINRIKIEGHKVKQIRNPISYGVCYARNKLIEEQLNWNTNAKLVMRVDDDVILEQDYLERLIKVIDSGFDIASGVVPLVVIPEHVRENKFIGKIINEHEFDNEGNLIKQNDDCGYCYLDEGIFPTHQFRTNALYKTEVHKKFKYPLILTNVGFREELWASFKSILNGFLIGIDVQAKAFHFQTASGGCRSNTYIDDVKLDQITTNKWIKEKFNQFGNFIEKYNILLREKGLLK